MYPRTMGIVQVGSKSPVVQVFMGVGVGGGGPIFWQKKANMLWSEANW
jgi:hypothetical protein